MKNLAYYTFWTLVILITTMPCTHVLGQQKIQVVTKTVDKKFEYKMGDHLTIQGQKSKIEIVGWEKEEIAITIKLISKALSKEVARDELELARYIVKKKGDEIELKNYFVLPTGKDQYKALLSASFIIKIPNHLLVDVTSEYGNLKLSELDNELKIDMRYGKLDIVNSRINGNIKLYFGDLVVKNLKGKSIFDLEHIKTEIEQISGELKMKTRIGDVEIFNMEDIASIEIDGFKSNIHLNDYSKKNHFYDLNTKYGKIFLPENNEGESMLSAWKYGNESMPQIKITTKYGDIKLEKR